MLRDLLRTVIDMSTQQPTGRWSSRTRLVTLAAIAAVGASGAIAIGANIGILDAANDSSTGNLSAAGDLAAPSTQVIDVYVDPSTTSTTAASAGGAQEFAVDAAGTVSVSQSAAGLRLDAAAPSAGWTWSLNQSGPTDLAVTFTNGVRTLEFAATTTAEGNVAASVTEPMTQVAPFAAGGNAHGEDDDHYEGGGDDD